MKSPHDRVPAPEKKDRREFLASFITLTGGMALAGTAETASAGESERKTPRRHIKLGFDNFSIRAMQWNASRLLEYAEKLKVDAVLFSNLGVYDSFDADYLQSVKDQADRTGIEIHVGTTCICPSSSAFSDKYGTAEEHLGLVIRVAKALGSPVARCYLGHRGDRKGEGGIYRHIETTVEILKKVRPLALDAGVKIAVENHAGDLQAWELVELIESAGSDFVGATMDAGNAVWTLEDPIASLEELGPYAVTTGIRDSAVWETETGASVQWTNMGDGMVDWERYLDLFEKKCPHTVFQLEIISGGSVRFDYLQEEFWKPYPRAKACDFARYLAMAKRGKPPPTPPERPTGKNGAELRRLQQRFDLEQSIEYCRNVLGLGLKT